MRQKIFSRFIILIITVTLFTAFAPSTLYAVDITLTVPTDHTTIQAAIDEAANLLASNPGNTYSVLVEPDTYSGNINLKSNIPVRGRETARTILTGSGNLITADNVTNVSIRNFTIRNASTGIYVINNASVTVSNNVFHDITGTSIHVQSGSADIINNTFYSNGTAINRVDNLTKITNNIFSFNDTAISPASITGNIFNNCFHESQVSDGPTGTDPIPDAIITNPNPLFVDINERDFHLEELSPCIDNGHNSAGNDLADNTTPDIGAYGGSSMDTIPFPVTVLSVTGEAIATPSITITWSRNESYLVTHSTSPGGYFVYYDSDLSGEPYNGGDASEGPAPVDTATAGAGTDATFTLNGLSPASNPFTGFTPPVVSSSPLSQALDLNWTTSLDTDSLTTPATGYMVEWGIATPNENSAYVYNATSYRIGGLTNNQWYKITVTPFWQATYYISITAYDSTTAANESFFSAEATAYAGLRDNGTTSVEIQDFPEDIVPYPNLPNEGCFIATAAYGFYSAPQVQALRDFRDHYLLANAPGRAFVEWYYTYGPVAAQFINEHPWSKPVVRLGLLPAVGVAALMTRTTAAARMVIFLFTVLILFLIMQRKLHGELSQH